MEWREVKVTRVAGYKPPSRPVRVAVVDSAGAAKTDLVLLPENFNKSKVTPQEPVSFDSAYMRTVREAARRNRGCASL